MVKPVLSLPVPAGLAVCAHAAPNPVYYEVVSGAAPHDVAAAPGEGAPVYYTAQRTGKLSRSAPHGVIVGPDGGAWITDGGQNAIVRVDPVTEKFDTYPSSKSQANVRQMLGRKGEASGAESGVDRLVMVPTQ